MRALRFIVLVPAAIVTGCQGANTVDRTEFDRLKFEVAALKAEVGTLAAEREALAQREKVMPVEPPKAALTYQLIGSSFKDDRTFKYPSKERCEEARATLLETWEVEDERNRERGVVFTSRPTPACLPL